MKKYLKKLLSEKLRIRLKIWFSPNTMYCPICNDFNVELEATGEKFNVIKELNIIGAGYRKTRCVHCGSHDRHRLIYLFLKEKYMKWSSNLKILHIAPEKAISKYIESQNISTYVKGDFYTEGAEYPEDVVHMDIREIPYEDETFDLIICNHVLEHVIEDKLAMNEIHRVLKNNGNAILQVPISYIIDTSIEKPDVSTNEERERIYGQFNHVRVYGKDYFERLHSVGLIVDRVNLAEEFPFYGLNAEEEIFFCKKNIVF